MPEPGLVERAKNLLDRLCETPRFAGSAEEERARHICRAELESAGFECDQAPFEFSEAPARWGPPLAAALQAATIITLARMALMGRPLLALSLGGALTVLLFFSDAYVKRKLISAFPAQRARSMNLEATRGDPRVWLVAHLDSKSQTVPMLVRIAGSILLGVMLVLAFLASMGELAGWHSVRVWGVIEIGAILGALPGMLCFVTNSSRGALDNASGVVAVILAAQSDGAPADLGVLVTSGEELGLAGARAWAQSATGSLRVINCDTVDDKGAWRCMAVERSPSGSSLIDVLDRVLDKGIVIDAWVRVSLVGIELATVEARIVVASIDTYLKYSEAVGLSAPVSRPRELTQGGAEELERMRSENADLKRRLERLEA